MTTERWEDSSHADDGILFMKVGTHAGEDLESIIERKQKEINDAGFALWGYGGNTCHPTSVVQPFASALSARGVQLTLAMQPMDSRHFAEQLRAEQFSTNGKDWEDIPAAIAALGSRYALWLTSLERVELELPLDQTRVAWGPSSGRTGSRYIRGRVDKACLELSEGDPPEDVATTQIGLVARVGEPYSVFLR